MTNKTGNKTGSNAGNNADSKVKIEVGTECDISGWMCLIDKVRDDFPGLETDEELREHKRIVLEFMERKSAICAKIGNCVVGVLLFSKEDGVLWFLAVDTAYRRQHIAEQMVDFMLMFMEPGKDIVVTTYRAGVSDGKAARAFYRHLGFVEGRITEECGSLVQEFRLKR